MGASKGGHGGGNDSEITGRYCQKLRFVVITCCILNSELFLFGGFLQVLSKILSPQSVKLDTTCKIELNVLQVVSSNFCRSCFWRFETCKKISNCFQIQPVSENM